MPSCFTWCRSLPRPLRALLSMGALLWVVTVAAVAHAQTLPVTPRSPLEESLVQEALEHFGWKEEPDPEGKTIESIEIYVFEVFDHRDPVPGFVNVFHARTRDWVVRQELLQSEGGIWSRSTILETERNLRALRQLSIANAVAVQGSSPDTVRLLIVVKDVWSLRLNSNWGYGTNGLDFLVLNPTEENLGGIRATLGGLFILERDRYFAGGSFAYPRMFGTNYAVGLSGGAIRNRFDGTPEGTYGGFSFANPLRTRRHKWGHGASASWIVEQTRKYREGVLDQVAVRTEAGELEVVPWRYESERFEANYYGVRSFGFLHKTDVTFGLELDHRRYRLPRDLSVSPEVERSFVEFALPVTDRRISPYITLATYKTAFLRVLNLETLGLQEDWRLGYGLSTSLFTAAEALGSSRNLIGSGSSLGYTVALDDGLLRAGVANRIVVANEERHEAFASVRARLTSPTMLFGRLHLDGYVGHRYQDYLNAPGFRLGGDNRLRGYAAGEFVGKNLAVANAEFRTSGVDILSAQVGLAAFYDLGAASDVLSESQFYQGTGAGVRILFPQADRTVLRLDWGLPVSGDRRVLPGTFFFTFGQAFPMPEPSGGGAAL